MRLVSLPDWVKPETVKKQEIGKLFIKTNNSQNNRVVGVKSDGMFTRYINELGRSYYLG